VYGPVRTVVWQGSAGDRRPYADLVGYPETMTLAVNWRKIAITLIKVNECYLR